MKDGLKEKAGMTHGHTARLRVLVFDRQIAELDGKYAEHDEKAVGRARPMHSL